MFITSFASSPSSKKLILNSTSSFYDILQLKSEVAKRHRKKGYFLQQFALKFHMNPAIAIRQLIELNMAIEWYLNMVLLISRTFLF